MCPSMSTSGRGRSVRVEVTLREQVVRSAVIYRQHLLPSFTMGLFALNCAVAASVGMPTLHA